MDKKLINTKLAHQLILDELFDLLLYEALYKIEAGDLKGLLRDLIVIEKKHFGFWQEFFGIHVTKLNFLRKIKLAALIGTRRIFGESVTHLALEAIEIYGVRKYLEVWDIYRHTALGVAVHEVLEDELHHEDQVVSGRIKRKIDATRVRDIFLGLNDGLVETMGAVSGFFAAFGGAAAVLVAGFTVAVAGAFSMAAGAYAAESSGKEVDEAEKRKNEFLENQTSGDLVVRNPLRSAMIVGVSYFIGAAVPIAPVLLGATNVLASIISGTLLLVCVSAIIAFLSGMDIKKRIMMNVFIMALAVGTTYLLGVLVKHIWGLNV